MKFKSKRVILCILIIGFALIEAKSQGIREFSQGWKMKNLADVSVKGNKLSDPEYAISGWEDAIVPGTVLTNLLAQGKVPDPFFGMNNEDIQDIFEVGKDHYTYWFVNDFVEKVQKNDQIWLNFRGVNYSCDVFLNGQRLNKETHKGMFLRQRYNITGILKAKGSNRLAVIVYPPDHVGNPNGGQGGDGTIGKNVAHQYVAGWDWIQPIRDRNTGIWDKVFIEKTKAINIINPHVVTKVPGKRIPGEQQSDAFVYTSVELENPTSKQVTGTMICTIANQRIEQVVELKANSISKIELDKITISNPTLWWPNGYGKQKLYDLTLRFEIDGKNVSDEEKMKVGIREIQRKWNDHTRSMEIMVNGQKIFIRGGNWIISDAMLRFTPERYDAEVRYHRDMNLNLIRIWGGALAERPEFYEACDKYGMLVIQDFWMSGDCNGRWLDPKKKDDQWTRRQYPDDHQLFLTSASDMIKMIRNHASLAMWCGGNEITPPEDILLPLRDEILPELDGTRWFIDYSNSDSMSYNFIGGNGDGPYTIQPKERFWNEKTFPFNSEVGSVGVGDIESLRRFIPEDHLVPPQYPGKVDPVWHYHKYIGYDEHIALYGDVKDADDFSNIAQLVNYDQYRALAEGFTAHKWDWYTGYIIWKTQNPWTALRGQMYDYYLDPNASLFALKKGNEQVHVMCNPVDGMVMVVNNSINSERDLMLKIQAYDNQGKDSLVTQVFVYIEPHAVKKILSIGDVIKKLGGKNGCFIRLQLIKDEHEIKSENLYWFPNAQGLYTGLASYEQPDISVKATIEKPGKIIVRLKNPEGGSISFFNRVSLLDSKTKERILPVFYSDNYVSIVPGEERTIVVEYDEDIDPLISVRSWKTDMKLINVD